MNNQVLIGDCAEVLKGFEDESIDCVITDPPYGLNFMNKAWDKALPSLEALKECNRVLKAGAFGFFMCAPRQDVLSRMIIRLEDAGFNVNFSSMFHAYASGFPKSAAMDKLVDKRNGRQLVYFIEFGKYLETKRLESGLNKTTLGKMLFKYTERGEDVPIRAYERGELIPTKKNYIKLKNILNLDNRFDELIEREEAQREIIGKDGRTAKNSMFGIGVQESWDLTAPATDKAKEFYGSFAGCNLKPALECVLVCMKNLDSKAYVDQALANGKGVSWLSDCKIPYAVNDDERIGKDYKHNAKAGLENGEHKNNKDGELLNLHSPDGRFPANLLVSDNILDQGIIHKRGALKPEYNLGKTENGDIPQAVYGARKRTIQNVPADSGDFSRYFSLDAWFDKKLSELPPEQQKTFPFLITPKPSKSEKNKYIENKHPTVKPLKLMSYLITMGSREGDTILDPFAGSGTTLEAAKLLNRQFIGIDSDPENEKYMRARGQLEEH